MTKVPWLEAHTGPLESRLFLERMVERRTVDVGLLRLAGISLPWFEEPEVEKRWDRGIGEACQRSKISQCTRVFGDKLFVACRSCPGVSTDAVWQR